MSNEEIRDRIEKTICCIREDSCEMKCTDCRFYTPTLSQEDYVQMLQMMLKKF